MYSLYQLIFFFYIYAFLGWCLEVCFRSVVRGEFVNSGFLNGTYCPIYGVGMVLIVVLLRPVQDNLPLLFITAVIITTLLEWVVGWVLHKLFHTRWWDYSHMPFNIGGYICPAFSLAWGIAACFAIKFVHPAIYFAVRHISPKIGIPLLCIISALFLTDIIVTVLTILKLNRHLHLLFEIASQMHETSDAVAKHLGNNAIEASEKHKDIQLGLQAKLDIAKADIIDMRIKGYSRLFKAFPELKHDKYDDLLTILKDKYLH